MLEQIFGHGAISPLLSINTGNLSDKIVTLLILLLCISLSIKIVSKVLRTILFFIILVLLFNIFSSII